MSNVGNNLFRAKFLLESNELVSIPTETVYGLAANAFDEEAVLKIFKAKNRPTFDPLIVHAASVAQIETFVQSIPDSFYILADAFWPGPLTILLPKKKIISDLVTSGFPNVAVRIPYHPLTLELLKSLSFPLAAPSANPFGYVSPTTAQHVQDQLGEKISYTLDGGPCSVGLESTIISIEDGEIFVHRPGGVPIEELEKFSNKKIKFAVSNGKVHVPGSMQSHYSPRKRLVVGNIESLLHEFSDKKVAILSFDKKYKISENQNQLVLSKSGNLDEAAKNLFSAIRSLDSLDVEIILAAYVPNIGLGVAINDRLRRAAHV